MSSEDPTLIRSLKGHKQSIIALDLYPSCKYIASAGMDNTIFLWNISKKTAPLKLLGHKSQIHDIKFSPTGNILVSASNDESLKFWDIDYENSKKETTLIKAHNARIRGLSFSCDGLLLASCGDDKLIKVWSPIDRRLQFTLKKHNNWVRNCQFSPTAQNLASCDDKFVYIWDVNTKKQIQSYKEHSGVIHRVKFHSEGNCMATCSHDTKIKLYDLRSQSVIQVYEGHGGPVKSIDFHPASPYLISSSDDGTTKIWNSKKGQLEYTVECHSNNTQFSRHGDYFITGGSEKSINIWKTGFYDSLKEKINQFDNVLPQKKVKLQAKDMFHGDDVSVRTEIPTRKNIKSNFNRESLMDRSEIEEKEVFYDHEEDNFIIPEDKCMRTGLTEQRATFVPNRANKDINKIEQISEQSENEEETIKIPQKLVKKLQRISSQLEFITKTTQILEARVLNNGDQLRSLIEIYQADD